MTRQELILKCGECTNLNAIFQVTDKCVLACKYCFARGAHSGKVQSFSDELLESAIKQVFSTPHESVTFEWTGGEALLVGLDFFKKIVAFQKKHANKPYENGVQTSGYLFDKKLIDFLVENNFVLSITIDGTEEIHNANRPSQKGTSSYQQIIETREYIKQKQGWCGFIATITKNNLGHEREILEHFATMGIKSFHSNPYLYYEKNVVKDKSIALSTNDYARYFIAQFNAWYDIGKIYPIPMTTDYFMTRLSAKNISHNTICSFGGRCLTNFVAIIPNGDAYLCPKFTGSKNMCLGNINDTTIKELLSPYNGKMSELIDERIIALSRCGKNRCEYAYICNGGCPYHSYITSNGENIFDVDALCEGKKMVLDYLKDVVNNVSSMNHTCHKRGD